MTEKTKNSKYQFRKFVKEHGVFARARKRNVDDEENNDSDKPQKALKYYFRRYINEFQDQKSRLAFVLFVGFCTCLIGAIIPWTSKVMIDYILPQRNMPLLLVVCVALFTIAVMRHFIQILQDYSIQTLMGRFVIRLKHRLMEHLHTLPLVELQKLKTGGIITRLQEDTEGAGNLIYHGLVSPFNALMMLLISMSSLLFISWKTTLVSIFFALLMCMVAYFFFYVMRPLQRALRRDRTVINASLTESFGGIQVVKSFRRENSIRKDFGISTNLLWRKSLYGVIAGMFVHRTIWSLHFFAEISIWLIGGYFFINGTLSVGSLVVFISFLMWIFQPVFMIMSSFSETQKCLACTERTIDLLDMEPDIVDKEDAVTVGSFKKGIEFRNVSFTYPDGTQALDAVNLFIPKGKVTALVGPSGGGKTTLTNLVLRFYDVTEGEIVLDKLDIRDIRLTSYRKLISLVLQDVFLFDGSVRDNIMFGKKDATQEEIEHAAKVAHCAEFIGQLQDKYDTIIGERGVKLSGGQKQRIALARAIIANPQLLILDEATSNLDSESESLIQNALKHIFKGRTSLVIAHRLSTIMDADNIIVIDKGKLIEQGKHEELLAVKGRYYEMYTKQMEKARSSITLWSDTPEPPGDTDAAKEENSI